MYDREMLREQLKSDLDRLLDLILRYAAGEMKVKQERDLLEGAVNVKLALFWGKKPHCH